MSDSIQTEIALDRKSEYNIAICVLASGSKGNAIYISNGETSVLLGAGLSGVEIERRLKSRGLPPEKLEKLFRLPPKALSLESPVEDGKVSLKDFIADQKLDSPLDLVAELQLHSATTKALQALTPREERIIRLRFGIGVDREHTLDEVGNKFGLTRERIRQIEKKALEKMRYLRKFQVLKNFSEN